MAENSSILPNNNASSVNLMQKVNCNEQINNVNNSGGVKEGGERKVWSMAPKLLSEYKYGENPQSLTNLLNWLKNNTDSDIDRNDVLFALIYILTLECGFIPANYDRKNIHDCNFNSGRIEDFTKSLPANWRPKPSNYHIEFVLRPTEGRCTLECLASNEDFIVNFFVHNVENFSILLDSMTYFPTTSTDSWFFQQLDGLSIRYKNEIAYKAKVTMLRIKGLRAFNSLEGLPLEILDAILDHLPLKSLLNLSETSMHLNKCCQNRSVWRKRIKWHFKMNVFMEESKDLKRMYMELYEEKKKSTRPLRAEYFWRHPFRII